MAEPDDDLADAIRELTRTIDELRTELEDSRSRTPRRPLAPRPPTPRELLRLADEVAIPTLLAALESSVRTLEAVQRGLEIVRTEREVREQVDETTDRTRTRASDLRRTTLSQLDTVLAELQRAASDGSLPADEDARDLLTEARELRDEVDSRLQRAVGDVEDRNPETGTGGPIQIDIEQPDDADSDDDDAEEPTDERDPGVDVDAELETLKDRYTSDEQPDERDEDGSDAKDVADAKDAADAGDTEDTEDAADEDENGDQTGSNR
ncbi:hypothetical protein CV102_21305 [Natronococcus pandeyae]|uniref:Uncharacterized protein n=1 Tax=Natronococcus pandeyae TaxID=2055836 RepID=A0A8J8TNQ5_9EURY|nr:hypothetical protein [Natronococcus pandeyae]TYL36593.1 hypothetical protein CV102_21305 [Natronococcus pandeyae]